ncbi:hypothetical protein KA005_28920, partial [bacterium]|nr:hypothetical protein [bacterium]
YPKVVACIAAGINGWRAIQKSDPEKCVPLTSCTTACIVNNYMVHHARKVFSGMEPDIMLISDKGFQIVDFFGSIKMRFKKLSNELHPYSFKTYQQQAYDDQALFDAPATLVTAGYRLDLAGCFRDAHIVCWAGPELLWSLRLPDLPEMQQPIETAPDIIPPQPLVAKKVRKANRKRAT